MWGRQDLEFPRFGRGGFHQSYITITNNLDKPAPHHLFLPIEGVQIRALINNINLSTNCHTKYRQGEINEY